MAKADNGEAVLIVNTYDITRIYDMVMPYYQRLITKVFIIFILF